MRGGVWGRGQTRRGVKWSNIVHVRGCNAKCSCVRRVRVGFMRGGDIRVARGAESRGWCGALFAPHASQMVSEMESSAMSLLPSMQPPTSRFYSPRTPRTSTNLSAITVRIFRTHQDFSGSPPAPARSSSPTRPPRKHPSPLDLSPPTPLTPFRRHYLTPPPSKPPAAFPSRR